MANPAGGVDRGADDPPEPGGPVRDLGPRRRRLYLAMVVPIAIVAVVPAASGSALLVVGLAAAAAVGYLALRIVLDRSAPGREHLVGARDLRAPAPSSPSSPEGRLATFLERLDRLPTDELRLLAIRSFDEGRREAARARAVEAARFGGRLDLVDDTSSRIADWLGRVFGTRSFDPELVSLAWRHEPLRLDDQERVFATLTDAGLAVAVEDLVDDATYGELVGPCGHLVGDAPSEEAGDAAPR